MSMNEIVVRIDQKPRGTLAVRGAQALFLVPLGMLQLVAAIVFSITGGVQGGQFAIGVWAVAMGLTGITVALRLGRGGDRVRRLAFTLLAAQTLFSVVKLTVYNESASYVFFAIVALAAALLSISTKEAQ